MELLEFWLDKRRSQVVIIVTVAEAVGFYLFHDLLLGILNALDMTESAFIPLIAVVLFGSLYYLNQLFYQRDLAQGKGERDKQEKDDEEQSLKEQDRLQKQFVTLCDAVKNGDASSVHYLKPFFISDDREFADGACGLFRSVLDNDLQRTQMPEVVAAILIVVRESQNLLSPRWPALHSFYRGINLSFADLSELSFKEADFSQADLHECNLSKAEFVECELNEGNLSGTKCIETDFTVVEMQNVSFESAILVGANFLKVDLSSSRCINAVFEDTDFEEVSFEKADLSGAVFRECRLEKTAFQGAMYNGSTVLPKGFVPEELGMVMVSSR